MSTELPRTADLEMKSTTFVHASLGIPAGPISENDLRGGKAQPKKNVAAVIRPMPRETGQEGRLRLDLAEDQPKAHIRSEQLDGYLAWLRTQIENTEIETPAARSVLPSRTQDADDSAVGGNVADADGGVAGTNVAPDEFSLGSYFSSVTTESDLSAELNSAFAYSGNETGQSVETESRQEVSAGMDAADPPLVPKQSAQSHRGPGDLTPADLGPLDELAIGSFNPQGFSTERLTRVDGAHASHQTRANVTFTESQLDQIRVDVPEQSTAGVRGDVKSFEEPGGTAPVAAAPAPIALPKGAESLISSISQAIAAVLTDRPEPVLEQQIKTHFATELHARVHQALGADGQTNDGPSNIGLARDVESAPVQLPASRQAAAYPMAADTTTDQVGARPTSRPFVARPAVVKKPAGEKIPPVVLPEPATAGQRFQSEITLSVSELNQHLRGSMKQAPTEQSSSASADAVTTTESVPVVALKSQAEQIAAEILNDSMKEISTAAAAWDVEDFRWPAITNHMIVSGGKAIDQLYQSTSRMIDADRQRIALAGLDRGEGTTSVAISLARWAAACGKRVLLVDADLGQPGLSEDVGLAPNLSWVNAVSQSLPPAEVVVRSQKSNLCIMPLARMVSPVTTPRFIYDNLGELVDQVRSQFDLVVFDVGPAEQMLSELSRPHLLVDAMLLVHDGIVSSEFSKTKAALERFGIDRFLVAQNRANRDSASSSKIA